MITATPKTTIVKVVRSLGPDGVKNPALIHGRNGRHPEEHYLSPDQERALGDQLIAYFAAERIGGRWTLKERLPDAKREW